MQIQQYCHYRNRVGEVVEVDSHYPKATWFPWKIRRADGTYYTVTDNGHRLWNVEDDEDLIEEVK